MTTTALQALGLANVALATAGQDPAEAVSLLVGALGLVLERSKDPVETAAVIGIAMTSLAAVITTKRQPRQEMS